MRAFSASCFRRAAALRRPAAATAIALTNAVASLAEDADTSSATKMGDIVIWSGSGLLASYDLLGLGTVRAGYQQSMAAKDIDDESSSWDYKNPFDGISFGGSLNLGSLIGGNMSIDYAYMPTEYFIDNQAFSLRVGF